MVYPPPLLVCAFFQLQEGNKTRRTKTRESKKKMKNESFFKCKHRQKTRTCVYEEKGGAVVLLLLTLDLQWRLAQRKGKKFRNLTPTNRRAVTEKKCFFSWNLLLFPSAYIAFSCLLFSFYRARIQSVREMSSVANPHTCTCVYSYSFVSLFFSFVMTFR